MPRFRQHILRWRVLCAAIVTEGIARRDIGSTNEAVGREAVVLNGVVSSERLRRRTCVRRGDPFWTQARAIHGNKPSTSA